MFRCLMFSLPGPCELLFFTLFYCLLNMRCSESDILVFYVLLCKWICLTCVLRV